MPAKRLSYQAALFALFLFENIQLILAGHTFFLLTHRFFINVSRQARSVKSRKIYHAILRAERRNSCLAFLSSYIDRSYTPMIYRLDSSSGHGFYASC